MVSIQRTPARRLRLRLMGTDRSAVVRLPDSRAGLTQRAAELFLDDDAAATGGTLPAARLYLGGSFELRDFELLRDDDEVVVAFGEPGGAYPGPHASTLVRPAHDAAFAEWLAAEAPIALAQLASWAAIPAPNRWLVRLRMMFGLFHTRWVRKLFQLGFTSYVPFLILLAGADPDRDGVVSEAELENFESRAREAINATSGGYLNTGVCVLPMRRRHETRRASSPPAPHSSASGSPRSSWPRNHHVTTV